MLVSGYADGPFSEIDDLNGYARTRKRLDVWGALFYVKNNERLFQVIPIRYLRKNANAKRFQIIELGPDCMYNDGVDEMTDELAESMFA